MLVKNGNILMFNSSATWRDCMSLYLNTSVKEGTPLDQYLHAALHSATRMYMSAHLEDISLRAGISHVNDESNAAMGHAIVKVTTSTNVEVSTLKFTTWRSDEGSYTVVRTCNN